MRTLRQTCVLAPATKVAADRSIVQPTTNFTYIIKSTNVYVQNKFHRVINYQHVSIIFAIIIRVALQEDKKLNKLQHGISGTTQYYNTCLKH